MNSDNSLIGADKRLNSATSQETAFSLTISSFSANFEEAKEVAKIKGREIQFANGRHELSIGAYYNYGDILIMRNNVTGQWKHKFSHYERNEDSIFDSLFCWYFICGIWSYVNPIHYQGYRTPSGKFYPYSVDRYCSTCFYGEWF